MVQFSGVTSLRQRLLGCLDPRLYQGYLLVSQWAPMTCERWRPFAKSVSLFCLHSHKSCSKLRFSVPLSSAKNAVFKIYRPGNRPCCVCLGRHVESSSVNPDRRCSSQPEALGADQEVTNGLKHSKKRLLWGASRPCRLQRAVNTEQAPKPSLRKPTRHNNGGVYKNSSEAKSACGGRV